MPAMPPARPLLLLPLALLALSAPAHAQSQDEDAPGEHLTIGAGVGYGPGFEGGNHYRLQPMPLVEYGNGRFFAGVYNGVGYRVVQDEHFSLSGAVAYVPGYRASDVPDGVGSMGASVGLRGAAHWRQGPFVATLAVTKAVAGATTGTLADASAALMLPLAPRWVLVPSLHARWMDDSYANRYFGINAGQSAASELRVYQPGGGLRDVAERVALHWHATDRLTLTTTLGVSELLGSTRNSPLVQHTTQASGHVGISYRFGRRR